MNGETPSLVKPALIAGIAFGVAGAIPIIEWINCACCALIIGCGFFAAYLHSKPMKAAGLGFTAGNGGVVGLASGVVYGVVAGGMGAIIDNLLGLTDMTQIIEQMEQIGTMDPEAMEMASRFLESTGPATFALAGIFFSLLLGAVFGALGGLIGGAVFKAPPTSPGEQAGQQWSTNQPPPGPGDPPPPPVEPLA
jgi:hypothetical protein